MNDELSYWILSFEVLIADLLQSACKASQENNILKLEKLIEEITKLLRVLMPIMERNKKEVKNHDKF